jgi:peptide/nickel transport system substrate-binding protein
VVGRAPRAVASLVVSTLLASACTGDSNPKPTPTASESAIPRGGTLHVGVFRWNGGFPYDPTSMGDFAVVTMYSCCLLRTLYYYNGRPAAQGGGELRPDLATGPPEVSPDGLVWTFHIKTGLHYAPPLSAVEITAQDFIRAIRRSLSPAPKELQIPSGLLGAFANYLLEIQGAQEYVDGEVGTISGLEAPDPHTLRVHLIQPAGDFPYRFSLLQTAPIPPNPFNPEAPFGVAEGHAADGYGRFLVSSGPYMIEGSEKLDFSKPAAQQQPASGLDPLVLVRNPSWPRPSDSLRPAFADRIEFTPFDSKPYRVNDFPEPTTIDAYRVAFAKKVDGGELDVVADWPAPVEQVRRYQADPALRKRLQINEFEDVRFLTLNIARPPFDDVHVRKAINFVIDKQRILSAWQAGLNAAAIYDHLAPDATEDNLLARYQPYPSENHAGDISAARQEMMLSAYDQDRDGKCDQPACDLGAVLWRNSDSYPDLAPIVRDDLAEIGITFEPKIVGSSEMYQACADPAAHAPLCQAGWFADYPSASTFFPPLYSSSALETGQGYSLVGASSDQLRTWGYDVQSVPNVDDRMRACKDEIGVPQVQCWAAFDQYLMEEIVPAVPILIDTAPWTYSARVAAFSFDQAAQVPALDQIAVKPDH